MRQTKWQTRSIFLYLAGLLIFAASALVSVYVPNASAQFIDRITRPCASGGGSSLVQTQTLNVLINTCTGGQVLVNGVPLVILPGGGLGDPGANGVVIRTALNTTVARTLTVTAPITIANGTGVAGNPLIACATCGITTNPLSQFAATTSAQLAGVISDESGSGPLIFATAPVFTNAVRFGTVSVATGQLNLANSASAFLTTIQAGNAAAARTYTWPTNFGAAGSVLTDAGGTGALSWAAAAPGFTCGACTLDTLQAGDGAGNFQDTLLTWNTTTLAINLPASGTASFITTGIGAQLAIIAADGDAVTPGGEITLLTGDSFGGSGGQLNLIAGSDPNGGDGGSVVMASGNSVGVGLGGDSGDIGITVGNGGVGDNDGGDITLNAGAAIDGQGGRIFLQPGISTNGTAGNVTLFSPSGAISLEINDILALLAGNLSVTGELLVALGIRTGTASNTDVAGTLTVGGGGTVTYTFTQTYATAPVCTSSDTDTTPLITGCSTTTTTLTVRGTAGHVVSYQCIGLN